MTETTSTIDTVTLTDGKTERFPRRVITGVLSNIETDTNSGTDSELTSLIGPYVLASLIGSYRGVETIRSLLISGEALNTVRDLLVEGASVRLYGEMRNGYVSVIGPDLTKRTLARVEARAETIEAPVAKAPVAKAPKVKRVMSEKQAAAWNTIIRPSLEAGRARKRAEQEAAAVTA